MENFNIKNKDNEISQGRENSLRKLPQLFLCCWEREKKIITSLTILMALVVSAACAPLQSKMSSLTIDTDTLRKIPVTF